MDLTNKVAIVTGGAQGIGRAISRALFHNGLKVLICDIDEGSGKSFIDELSDDFKSKVVYQKCDVSSYEELKAAFKKARSTFGGIDVVINNAGILNESQWKRMIEVNFIGVINGIQLAFEFMGRNNGGTGGVIINTGSNAGLRGFDLAPIYSGCKHGVIGLTRSYGTPYHFDKTGVTVNAVCPGAVSTELFHRFPKGSLDEALAVQHNSRMKPINPDEVAKAVIQLITDGKNGALLEVNHTGRNYAE